MAEDHVVSIVCCSSGSSFCWFFVLLLLVCGSNFVVGLVTVAPFGLWLLNSTLVSVTCVTAFVLVNPVHLLCLVLWCFLSHPMVVANLCVVEVAPTCIDTRLLAALS